MLKLVGINAVGTTGSQETITLSAATPRISAADYRDIASGATAPVVIAADGKSVSLTVAAGLYNLTLGLSAPGLGEEYVAFYSGPTPLRYATVRAGAGNAVIPIVGK